MVLIERASKRKRPRVEIVPMIDVMFFLVVFFMLFSSFHVTPDGIHVSLPRAATAQEQVPSELVVTITAEGAYYLEDRLTTIDGLQAAVAAAVTARPDVVTVFRIDREAKWDWVIAAWDAMRLAGGSDLSFTVERLPSGQI